MQAIAAARSYPNASTGTFLSEDPIGLAGGINPYVFAGNDPINNYDPTGAACKTMVKFRLQIFVYMKDGKEHWYYKYTILDVWEQCDGGGADRPYRDGIGIGGGAGGGNQPGSGQSGTPEKGPSCGLARFNAALTILSDAAFFTGVYAGVRLGQAAIRAGTYGLSGLWGTAQGRAFATVDAGRKALASSNAYAAAAGTYVASTPGRVGSGLAAGNFNALDFIPGAASVRAIQSVQAVCGGIF